MSDAAFQIIINSHPGSIILNEINPWKNKSHLQEKINLPSEGSQSVDMDASLQINKSVEEAEPDIFVVPHLMPLLSLALT